MEQGLLHLYWGYGKGKTTAAMGLALRALGSGKRVVIVQFLKGGNSGEIPLLAQLGAEIYRGKAGQKFVFQMNNAEKAATRDLQDRNLTVAMAQEADLLVLLSDIDGLYDADPKTHPGAKLLHRVEALTPEILDMAGGAGSWRGTGGMATKLSAARIAMEAGCDMVITNGSRMEDLYGIAEGKDIGTRFVSGKTRN